MNEVHDCERWAEEGMGCSICSRSGLMSVEEIRAMQGYVNGLLMSRTAERDAARALAASSEERAARAEARTKELINADHERNVRLDAAEADAERLRGALAGLLDLFPTEEEGATGYYDRRAMEFWRETHVWPPGKSAPADCCIDENEEQSRERYANWEAWGKALKAKRVGAARAALEGGAKS